MASFSFGAGNVRKLLRLPLYLVGRAATIVIPRRPGLWVFGSAVGLADGAWALWQVAASEGRNAVWLVSDAAQEAAARAEGIPCAHVHSPRGFWLTARAAVAVVTHGFGDVNRYAITGAFIVQLWHGIPLKRIGLDSPETVRSAILDGAPVMRWLLTAAYRRTVRRIGLIPAASHLVRGRLQSAFALPDAAVPVTGEPRVDVLSQRTAGERRAHARDLLDAAIGGTTPATSLVLYAPTWRDGAADPAVPTASEWDAIIAVLDAHDAVLLVRSHPLGAGAYSPPVETGRVRLLPASQLADVTPVLPALDVLITDYSSLAYDAGLVPLATLFLAPDLAPYTASRGMYGTYADVTHGAECASWADLTTVLARVLEDEGFGEQRRAQARELSGAVHGFRDGHNTQRVYRAILARAGRVRAIGGKE